MGFLDDLTDTLNRGASVTARTASVLKLKAQIADLNSQRRNLCAGLGASLYDRTRGDAAFTGGLEDFYHGIATCDERIADLQRQVDALEAQRPVRPGSGPKWMRTCATCGYRLQDTDVFCSRCGTPVPREEREAAYAASASSQPGSGAGGPADAASQPPCGNAPIDVEPCPPAQ